MRTRDRDTVLEIVDLVLGDLRLRDRMFVARRPDPEHPDLIVIQTGEDGRHALPVPIPSKRRSVEMFIVAAQAHLHEVYEQTVPLCPEHDHALVPGAKRGGVEWVCPDGGWSCALGASRDGRSCSIAWSTSHPAPATAPVHPLLRTARAPGPAVGARAGSVAAPRSQDRRTDRLRPHPGSS